MSSTDRRVLSMATMTKHELEQILYRHDPMSLASMGAPEDEYEAEAGTIVERLPAAASAADVTSVMVKEFERWFGAEITPPRPAFAAAAEEVWATLAR